MPAVGGSTAAPPSSGARVQLRELDPDFLRFVDEDERQRAGELVLPGVDLEEGPLDPYMLLSEHDAYCGVVISGMINRQMNLDHHVALSVLGPRAIISAVESSASELITSSEWAAVGSVKLAIVGAQFTRAAARWPELQRNLLLEFADQNEQLATQLALCQLPRVEDRLLGMLWLLAESWGRVTSAGTVLPLHFTHEALGAMVGARRPTVTLALGELADRGAVIQREGGWLLIEPPPRSQSEPKAVEGGRILDGQPTVWVESRLAERVRDRHSLVQEERSQLFEVLARLREEHRRTVGAVQASIRRAETVRGQTLDLRKRMRYEREFSRRRVVPPG